MNRRYKKGDYIDFVAAADIPAGTVHAIGDRAVVTTSSFKSGDLAAGAAVGEFLIDKDVLVVAEGVDVFWNDTTKLAVLADAGVGKLGIATAAAGAGVDQVRVLLGP